MSDTIYLLIIILTILNIMSVGIGYIIGRIQGIHSQNILGSQPIKYSNKQYANNEKSQSKITIDDRKFVTDISTDGIEKKYNELGKVQQTDENISSSVNKLQNLKR